MGGEEGWRGSEDGERRWVGRDDRTPSPRGFRNTDTPYGRNLKFVFGGRVGGLPAVDDDGLDERVLQLDAVRELLAHQTRHRRQKQQRTERQDAEVDRPQKHVQERQPAVLALQAAHTNYTRA